MLGKILASILFTACVCTPSTAFAQEQGYVLGSLGIAGCCGYFEPISEIGAGWEGLIKNRFGIGTEFSRLAPLEELEYGIFLWSISGTAHLTPKVRSPRTRPFITGGVTFALADGLYPLATFGGGVERWFGDRVGFRFEARDSTDAQGHLLAARFGLVFRGRSTRP